MIAPIHQPPPPNTHPRKGSVSRLPRLQTQECPVCGRPVAVSADLSGRIVACGHCGGKFHVSAESRSEPSRTVVVRAGGRTRESLLERVEELLADCRA